jgi:hypothetical protein
MAVPSYTTDLLTFNDCTSATGWGEATGMTSSGGPDTDTDLAIQGSTCITQDRHNTGLSSQVYTGSEPAAWTTGDCFFIWTKFFAPNSLNNLTNGGQRVLIGSSSANYYGYYMDGSDTYAYGGWVNYAVDPSISAVRDQTQGSPSGTWNTVGNGWNSVNQVKKGNPMNTDVITWGRGELIITGGQTSNYAVFSGIAAVNDATTARWGLLQDVGGSYLWKGLMTLGTASNLVDFRDSNVAVTIDDTIKVGSSFNRIEINNASSNIEWTGVVFTKVGTVAKGEFEMVDNATVDLESCTFNDMSTFVFDTNATLLSTTFNRCGQVTQGGATFNKCTFLASTAATTLLTSDLDEVYDCVFQSDGSNHAIELTSAHAGGSFDLIGCTFTSYATTDGSTGNEVIYNNSGGAVTINASGNTGTISVRNGTSASTTVVIDPVATSITVKDLTSGTLLTGARVLVWVTDNTNYFFEASVTVTGTGTAASVAHTGHGLATNDYVIIADVSDDAYNGTFQVTVTDANNYTYTTVDTITSTSISGKSTFAVISGTTTAGVISDTRSWGANQTIAGRVRLSSTTIASETVYLQQGVISGTINSTSGFSTTLQLVRDQ